MSETESSELASKVRAECDAFLSGADVLTYASEQEFAEDVLTLLARLAAVEAERDEYKRRDQLKANRPLAESLLFRDKSEMSDAEQAVATYVGQCVAARAAAEDRVEAAEQALRAYETAADRHDLWCGYRAESPGDGSLNHARSLAAAVLSPVADTQQEQPHE